MLGISAICTVAFPTVSALADSILLDLMSDRHFIHGDMTPVLISFSRLEDVDCSLCAIVNLCTKSSPVDKHHYRMSCKIVIRDFW